MPRASAWFVRVSLVYLAGGFSLGGMMLANEGWGFAPQINTFLPAHIEILMIGWVMQLALGVAYWILPRFTGGLPRGNKLAAWTCLILINLGILLVAGNVFLQVDWLALLGRLLEMISLLVFLSIMWRRVRSSA